MVAVKRFKEDHFIAGIKQGIACAVESSRRPAGYSDVVRSRIDMIEFIGFPGDLFPEELNAVVLRIVILASGHRLVCGFGEDAVKGKVADPL